MKLKYLLTILPVVAALTGCGQSEVGLNKTEAGQLAGPALTATPSQLVVYPDDRPSIPDGKPTYVQNCASCHGMDGQGGPNVTVKFDQAWSRQVKPVDMFRTVAFGDPNKKHPAFSEKLQVREMWNAVLYAKSLGQPALTDEQLAVIDPVFGSNCAVCHGTKGDGEGPLAHNLDPMPANFQRFERFFNRTDDVLFDHIANGIRWEGMPNFLGKQDRKKNVKFDEAYIRQLVQYVHKFHVNNAPVLSANAGAGAAAPSEGTAAPTPTSEKSEKTDKKEAEPAKH